MRLIVNWRLFLLILLAIIILIGTALPLCLGARGELIYNSRGLVLETDISSSLSIMYDDQKSEIEYASADLFFFPKSYEGMEVLSLTTVPSAQQMDDKLHYLWKKPAQNDLPFSMKSVTRTEYYFGKVGNKVKFPLEHISEDVTRYTKPAVIIDSENEDIIKIASSLAAGEDDLYDVVFNIAYWIKENVHYNLSSATIDISQKASWVLRQKTGVCDEITSLFIAMLRSVGIPGKYVSGVAYTNLDELDLWGPHAWAEVYFPGYGWVPFDVTYGEFGYIDASHIKLKESVDANEPSTRYESFGRGVRVNAKKINISTKIVNLDEFIAPFAEINISVPKPKAGFGSYNIVEARLRNTNPYYIVLLVFLDVPDEIELVEPRVRQVLLKPNENLAIFWTVHIKHDLKQEYVYTIPIVVSTLHNVNASATINASVEYPVYSYSDIAAMKELIAGSRAKSYSVSVDFMCNPEKKYIYEMEDFRIVCKAVNKGNLMLSNLNMCLSGDCYSFDLGITQAKNHTFLMRGLKAGLHEFGATLTNQNVSKQAENYINILDMPLLQIEDIVHPKAVSFGDEYTVTFSLVQKSESDIENVTVRVVNGDIANEWRFDEIQERHGVVLRLPSEDLKEGANSINISVIYHGKTETQYVSTKNIIINLENIPFLVKARMFVNMLIEKIAGVFT